MADILQSRRARARGAAPTWVVGVAGLLIGMLAMWILIKVDFSSLTSSGASSPEALARAAFDALQAEDFEAWRPYSPNADDLNAMYDRVVAAAGEKRRGKIDAQLELDGGFRGMAMERFEENQRTFKEALAAAKTAGIDWSRAVFDGVDDSKTRFREKYGIRNGRVAFAVRVGDQRHLFLLRGCAAPGARWVCANGIKLLNPKYEREIAPVDPKVESMPQLPSAGLPARREPQRQPSDRREADAAAAQLKAVWEANRAKQAWERRKLEEAGLLPVKPKVEPAKADK